MRTCRLRVPLGPGALANRHRTSTLESYPGRRLRGSAVELYEV